jgi:hypothetical protein
MAWHGMAWYGMHHNNNNNNNKGAKGFKTNSTAIDCEAFGSLQQQQQQ